MFSSASFKSKEKKTVYILFYNINSIVIVKNI